MTAVLATAAAIFSSHITTPQPVKKSQIAPLESNSMDIGKQLKYHNAFFARLEFSYFFSCSYTVEYIIDTNNKSVLKLTMNGALEQVTTIQC